MIHHGHMPQDIVILAVKAEHLMAFMPVNLFNTLVSGWFWRFSQKNSSFRLPYQRPSSSADCARELFNGSKGSASLVDYTRKKIFCLGGAGFL